MTETNEFYIKRKPPTLLADLVLCFESDIGMDIIADELGIIPAEAKQRSETRVNPITNKHNPGYYRIATEPVETYESADVFAQLMNLIENKIPAINKMLRIYNGKAYFHIYADINEESEYPAIRLEKVALDAAHQLSAAIDVVFTTNYPTAGENEQF